jgi:hypothetical protein
MGALNKAFNKELVASYQFSDQDTDSDPKYYGFLAYDGSWYIQEENTAEGTFRFCRGDSGYEAAWAARTGKTYVLFNSLFA